MNYEIIKGIQPPIGRPIRRRILDGLVALAKRMEIGDCVVLDSSESQTFRLILAAQGFLCVTDGYRCKERGRTLAFKLEQIVRV